MFDRITWSPGTSWSTSRNRLGGSRGGRRRRRCRPGPARQSPASGPARRSGWRARHPRTASCRPRSWGSGSCPSRERLVGVRSGGGTGTGRGTVVVVPMVVGGSVVVVARVVGGAVRGGGRDRHVGDRVVVGLRRRLPAAAACRQHQRGSDEGRGREPSTCAAARSPAAPTDHRHHSGAPTSDVVSARAARRPWSMQAGMPMPR